MAISLNTVNSEVVRAHKRIDDISFKFVDLLGEGYPKVLNTGEKIILKDFVNNYKLLLIEASSPSSDYTLDNAVSSVIYVPGIIFDDSLGDTYSYVLSSANTRKDGNINTNYFEFKFGTDKCSIVSTTLRHSHISLSKVIGIV